MIEQLREILEVRRRRRLHAQIGAVTREINIMAARNDPRERTRFFKLVSKKHGMERELHQPMLIDPSRYGGAASEA